MVEFNIMGLRSGDPGSSVCLWPEGGLSGPGGAHAFVKEALESIVAYGTIVSGDVRTRSFCGFGRAKKDKMREKVIASATYDDYDIDFMP